MNQLAGDVPGREVRNARRIAQYRERNARYLSNLQDNRQKARADDKWKSWLWAPAAAELAAFEGRYTREHALLPDATVVLAEGTLFLTTGERRYRLTPATADLFGAQTYAYDETATVAFVRGPDGKVVALDWNGERYGKR